MMAETSAEASFLLVVPANSSSPASSRLFVGAVLGGTGHSDEVIADAKLAVSEAVTLVVAEGAAEVTVEINEGLVKVGPLGRNIEETMSWTVIAALFPDAAFEGAVRFQVA